MADISFSGLASGIDIASMIEKLVAVDSVPLTSIKKKQESIQNEKAVWNEINSTILGLQETLTKVSKTILGGTLSPNLSNENILSASISNSSIQGSYNVNVSKLAKNLVISSDVFNGNIGKSGEVIINDGKKDLAIQIENSDTLDSISKKINNANGDITSYVIDGKLVLSHKKFGEDSKISFKDSNRILRDLGLVNINNSIKNINQSAEQSKISVNGIEVSRNSNTVDDLIPGMILNLKSIGETSISVEDNVDEMVSAINDFIKAYNDTMNIINTKLSEEVPKETTSLNAKQGLLRSDSMLSSMKYSFRTNVLGALNSNSSIKYLRDIGINISSDNFGKSGNLQLVDEDKLRECLKNDRNNVVNLFISDVNNDNSLDSNDTGLLAYLNNYIDTLSSSSNGSIVKTMESLDSRIKNLDKEYERKELLVEAKRARYEKQFTAMESRISNITSNGEYLLSTLSSLSN